MVESWWVCWETFSPPPALVVAWREGDMQEMVVEHRVLAHQTADRAAHQRKLEQALRSAPFPVAMKEWGARYDLRDGVLRQQIAVGSAQLASGRRLRRLAGFGHELGVDLLGHGRVEAQEAAGGEGGHLLVGEQDKRIVLGGHGVSIHCSKKNSYFR